MPVSQQTFSGFGQAVQDIFSSQANAAGLRIQSSGTLLQARGTRIQAEGSLLTARGDITEAENYDTAAALARTNEQFVKESTAVQQVQADRQLQQSIGETTAQTAGAGLAASSSTDLLRSSVQQGALNKQLIGAQGQIQEAGYEEQAQSYTNLASYARYGAGVETTIAGEQQQIATGQEAIAASQTSLAKQVEQNGEISAAIDIASSIAGIFLPGPK